jgi:hypothetical protein
MSKKGLLEGILGALFSNKMIIKIQQKTFSIKCFSQGFVTET